MADKQAQKPAAAAPNTRTPASRELMAVIGDEDSVTGMLLAGVGQVDETNGANYLIVTPRTTPIQIEDAFRKFTTERADIAILLITQQTAHQIRHLLDAYTQIFPTILEIPSKDTPYDPSQDSVLKRVQKLAGN